MRETYPRLTAPLERSDGVLTVSVASLWEIAVKIRIGKLTAGVPSPDLPRFLRTGGAQVLAIEERHATVGLDPEPPTRDPFDRMLLAQCGVEGMRLVTVDRTLADHPLAWRARRRRLRPGSGVSRGGRSGPPRA